MEEWKEYKLGEISDIQTGPFGSQLHQKDYVPLGTPCIMPTNIGNRLNIDTTNIAHVKGEDVIRLQRHCVKEGDIIYSRRGDIEKCAYILPVNEGWLCGTGCLRIRVKDNDVNSRFVAYQLSTCECKKWIVGNAVGSTMLNLNTSILKELPLRLPSKNEQDRLVNILKSLDDKIEVNRRINDNLEQQAQALFKSWLSLCKYEVTIGDLSMNITDYTKCDQKEVVLINSSDVTEGYFTHHNLSKNENLKGHFKKRFTKGDILYSQVRPRNRHWGYCTFDAENYLASTQLMVIRNKKDIVPSILLYQYLIDDNVWMDFTLKTETRSGTFPQGNYEDLSSIKVPFGADVNDISIKLKSLYTLLFNNEEESRRLASLRDTLLPRLMSGEIKVGDVTL